ncbi:MAG: glycosyltransferase family 4 protein [Pseudomonadales bacterium]|nr:glycosyltransferase family 4 protein [Pseudomonadales bacterium]
MTGRRVALAVPGDLATPTGGYGYDRRLLTTLREMGHDVEHVELGASFPDPTPADAAAAAARLAAIPADRAVLVDGLAFGVLDPEALAAMKAPVIALVHHPLAEETGLSPARRAALVRSERANLARAAHVIVTSAHTAALLGADYDITPERITVARPGSDRRRRRGAPAQPPLVLAVGIQVPRKGHDILLQALALLLDHPWQAVIVGAPLDVGHAQRLAGLVDQLELGARVRLAGHVSETELADLYGRAHLFALATRYEGYGIVFDEAMRHGLPIVSCGVGAVPDTVAAGAGLLVPPGDPAAFGAAIARVLDESGLHAALASASAAAGDALPSWTATAARVAAVIARVAEEHGHA